MTMSNGAAHSSSQRIDSAAVFDEHHVQRPEQEETGSLADIDAEQRQRQTDEAVAGHDVGDGVVAAPPTRRLDATTHIVHAAPPISRHASERRPQQYREGDAVLGAQA